MANHAEVIANSLAECGVEFVFGVPGGAIEPLNNALHKSTVKVIVAKHEEGAAFMADGYARVSGEIGVCCSTAGPGATNMITGLASSFADSIPVIALTGQVATSLFGKGAIQEFSMQSSGIVSIFRQVTKYSDIIINEISGFAKDDWKISRNLFYSPSAFCRSGMWPRYSTRSF